MEEDYLKEGVILKKRYRTGKILGTGGFGITYLADDETLGQAVVIKEFFPREIAGREKDGMRVLLPREKNDRKRFLKGRKDFLIEARRLSQLFDIPEIVKVLDWFEENETAYLVMEFVRGITLNKYLQRLDMPLSFRQAWEMIRPVAAALEKVHKKGIIHRDLNPENLIVQEMGNLKIIDFGAARKYLDTEKTMTILIKKGYAPPEQYMNNGKQGPWSDVYGLCATLYEMITGVRPESSLDRVQKDELYLPSAYGAEISPEEEKVLCRGLEMEPEKRYRNMEELKEALEPEREVSRKKEKRRFVRILGISTAAFLLMIGGGIFFILFRGGEQKKAVSYAGNYGRQTKKYEEYVEFVKKYAIYEKEEMENSEYMAYPSQGKSMVYTLDPEAVQEWGEPCNQFRFEKKNGEFLKWMENGGYPLEQVSQEENNTVKIYQYGAVITDFSRITTYRTEQGDKVVTQYDSVNQDLFRIYFGVKDESSSRIREMMTLTGEFLEQEYSPSEEDIRKEIDRLEGRTQDEGWMDTQFHYWLSVLDNDSGETTAWGFGPNKRITDYGWYYWP